MNDKITIELTPKQLKKLSGILYDVNDQGPWSAGWASDELWELREIIDDAEEKASGPSEQAADMR